MLDRDSIYNNVLDRIERLEQRVEDMRDVSRPSETIIVEQPDWQAIAGWVSTGAVLRDVTGKIILDPSIPRIQIGADGYIESADFVAGNTGFQINGGTAEFNDIVIRGTIYATAGEIAGWTIGADNLAKNDAVLHSGGYLSLGTGNDLVRLDAADADYRLWIGHATKGSAPFRVGKDGEMWATDAHISGEISATTGTIGGWTITASQIKSDGDLIILDKAGTIVIGGAGGYLSSNPFSSGIQGWRITQTEAEFGNIVARGEIRTAVFKFDEVHAQAGQLLVTPNAAKLEEDLTIAATGDSFDVGESGRFAANDIVRLKDGTNDVWLSVTADNGDGTYDYDRESGAAVSTVFRAGTAVVGYGASGEGGVLLDAVTANGPFLDVFTHAGSPWTTLTTKVRLGNLAGIVDADLSPSGYGLYCDNVFLKGKLAWSKGVLDSDGITLDIDEAFDEAWIKFDDANNYIRGISGGGVAVHSLADWIDIRAWGDDSNARCVLAPDATGHYAMLAYVNTESGDPDTLGFAKLLYQDYTTETAVVAAGYRQVRMYAYNGSVYEWIELQPDDSEVFVKLGDAAGSHKFRVKDSAGNTVWQVDSDGVVECDGDIYPDQDGWGLFTRMSNRIGSTTYTDHFRSGSIPSGYAWDTGALFTGTPGTLTYDYADSYLRAGVGAGTKAFLRKAITNNGSAWQNKSFDARVRCALNGEVGLRFDNGSDVSAAERAAEVYFDGSAGDATITLKFRYKDATGWHTVASNIVVPASEFYVIRLLCYYTGGNYYAYAYLIGEEGTQISINNFNVAITWPPCAGRAGVFVANPTGSAMNAAYVDWFYNQFG